MQDNKKNNKTFPVAYYAVAYIDVLNQKEIIKKLSELPEKEEELIEYRKSLDESVGKLYFLRFTIDEIIKGQTLSTIPNDPRLNEEQVTFIKNMQKAELKKQFFSDTLVYYTSIAEIPERLPIMSVYTLLTTIALTTIVCLSEQFTFRGGIELGVGCEYFEDEIYGPALYSAYRLENEIAKYPRIVIGSQFIAYLKELSELSSNKRDAILSRTVAQQCLQMIVRDIDGLYILDFLGAEIKRLFDDNIKLISVLKKQVEIGRKFVISEYNRFLNEENAKLAERFFLFKQYINHRYKSVWTD